MKRALIAGMVGLLAVPAFAMGHHGDAACVVPEDNPTEPYVEYNFYDFNHKKYFPVEIILNGEVIRTISVKPGNNFKIPVDVEPGTHVVPDADWNGKKENSFVGKEEICGVKPTPEPQPTPQPEPEQPVVPVTEQPVTVTTPVTPVKPTPKRKKATPVNKRTRVVRDGEVEKTIPSRTIFTRTYRMKIVVHNLGNTPTRYTIIDRLPRYMVGYKKNGVLGAKVIGRKVVLKPGGFYVWRPRFRLTSGAYKQYVTNCVELRIGRNTVDRSCDTTFDD